MNLALNPSNRFVKKIVCVVCCCVLIFHQTFSQAPAQSKAIIFPGPLGETVNSVTTDASGNSYFTGMFSGTVDVDPGAGVVNLTATGALDVFVLKLNAAGGLVWARSFGSEEAELAAYVQSDLLGNVYVTGNFSAAMDVDPGPGSFILNSNGETDAYLVKLDASGNFLWGRAWGSTGSDGGSRVQVDDNNQVCVVGTFSDTIDIGSNRFVSAGGADVFLIKLDEAGHLAWAGSVGGPNFETVYGLDIDARGNIYFGGTLTGPGDLDPGPGVYPISALSELEQGYLIKVNSSGSLLWAKTIEGTEGSNITKLKLDAAGNVYCLGGFFGSADLDPDTGGHVATSQGNQDIFLLKLDTAGNLGRATTFGGPTQDFAQGLFIDPSGQCYVAGTFSSTVDFDPGPGTAELTAAGIGSFLAKLDAAGNYVYATQIEGTFVRILTEVGVVGATVYVTGNFIESVVFAGTTYYTDDLAPDAVIFVYNQPVALPFTFIRFEAGLNNQHAQLEWLTGIEKNVSQYMIERSFDGNSYAAIANRKARKNGRFNRYKYTDPDRLTGTVHYRLKAVGMDGGFAYSPVRTLTARPNSWVKVYPNPAHGAVIINTYGLGSKAGPVTVEFYNVVGVLVKKLTVLPATSQVVRLHGLRAGVYTLKITAPGFTQSIQLIVQ